jgi:hypothetical protein
MKVEKSKINTIFNIIMLLCIMLLVAVTQNYLLKQKLLILESNNLLSSNHIQANNYINSRWKDKINKNDNIWVMGTIEIIDDIKVVGFFASKFDDIILPINRGRIFSENDELESIVGDDVPTYNVGNTEIFKYNNKEYKVIGKMGLIKDSPLKKTALINDSVLLEARETILFFDGPDVDKASWLEGECNNIGIERWLNLTYFSINIKNIVILMIFCSSVLWSYNLNITLKKTRELYIQTGIRLIHILKKELAYLTFIFCTDIIIVYFLVNINNVLEDVTKRYISLYISLIVLYSILFFNQVSRGKSSYE